jgi:hypothetical protein
VGNRRIILAETKGAETLPGSGFNMEIAAGFRPTGAFDQYFPLGGARFNGMSLPFFQVEKAGKSAEN